MSEVSESIDKVPDQNKEENDKRELSEVDSREKPLRNEEKLNIMRDAGCDWGVEDFDYFMSK